MLDNSKKRPKAKARGCISYTTPTLMLYIACDAVR
jgi:hypothetical protein